MCGILQVKPSSVSIGLRQRSKSALEDLYYQSTDQPSAPKMELVVDGWRSNSETSCDLLVLIPGFNNSTKSGTRRLGQLLALGSFPPHIKPWLFSWPSGQVLSFWQVTSNLC